MKTSKAFYLTFLYPFQDGIISLLKEIDTAFYLTGGTALSRGYFNHRFSDDLDYFVNANPDYLMYVKSFLKKINKSKVYRISKTLNYQINDDFSRFFLEKSNGENDTALKIDFVNDIDIYYGKTVKHHQLGRIDNPENILVNKITALTRFEPKDIADIWIIARNRQFNWNTIMKKAKSKDRGVSEEEASGIIKNFPLNLFEKIRWNIRVEQKAFQQDINRISKELLDGVNNTLCE